MKKIFCFLTIMAVVGMAACSIGKEAGDETVSLSTDASSVSENDDVSGGNEAPEIEVKEGVYADYAFITIGEEIKRYKLFSEDLGDVDLACVSDDNLLFKWGAGDAWRFYEMNEYPELDRVLGLGPGGGIFEAAPFQGVKISEIEAVKDSEAVLLLNGSVESGKEIWEDFYTKTSKHMPASVIIADCYTQSSNVSEALKQAEAGDYPCLYFTKLTYDGVEFVLEPVCRVDDEYVVRKDEDYDRDTKYFKYLRHFEGEAEFPTMIYSYYSIYILTDDDTSDRDEIESSQWMDTTGAIPYAEVFGEYTWKDNAPFLPLQ